MKKLFFKFLLGGIVLQATMVAQEYNAEENSDYTEECNEDMHCENEFRDNCRYYNRSYQPSYRLQFERSTSWPGRREDSFTEALTR